jgi:hypothetical protein
MDWKLTDPQMISLILRPKIRAAIARAQAPAPGEGGEGA